jgi:CheY-like chemotaxis protein
MTEPLAVAEMEAMNVAASNSVPSNFSSQPADSASSSADAPPARLLLISSNDDVASDIVLAAQVIGFSCDVCEQHQALPFLASNTYDAAILDVIAQETDFPLIEEARLASKARQIPIVALAHPSDVNAAFRAGASFAVARPLNSDLLKNTLAAIYRIAVGQRRQYARYRVEIPLALTVEGQAMDGKASDLGHGGMAVVTAEPLKSGANVSMRFFLPGSGEQIIAVGEVRWTDHRGHAGLCFNSIAGVGRNALDNWIARRHAGMEDPAPRPVTRPAQPPPLVVDGDNAADPTRRTSRIALSAILAAFCLFVVGFWIYLAMTS